MTYSGMNDERTERFCPMHGETQAFTAPSAGYTKEPGCVCPVLPYVAPEEPVEDIREQTIDAMYNSGYSHDPVEAVRRLMAKAWSEGVAASSGYALSLNPYRDKEA